MVQDLSRIGTNECGACYQRVWVCNVDSARAFYSNKDQCMVCSMRAGECGVACTKLRQGLQVFFSASTDYYRPIINEYSNLQSISLDYASFGFGVSELKRASSCADKSPSGIVLNAEVVSCSKVDNLCNHSTYGGRVRAICPVTCNVCTLTQDVGIFVAYQRLVREYLHANTRVAHGILPITMVGLIQGVQPTGKQSRQIINLKQLGEALDVNGFYPQVLVSRSGHARYCVHAVVTGGDL